MPRFEVVQLTRKTNGRHCIDRYTVEFQNIESVMTAIEQENELNRRHGGNAHYHLGESLRAIEARKLKVYDRKT